jgi:hypothetical protein
MKAKGSLGVTCLVAVGLAFAYGLGYEHGRSSAGARLSQASSLRQIGLRFRIDRNTMTRFDTTGTVANPGAESPGH